MRTAQGLRAFGHPAVFLLHSLRTSTVFVPFQFRTLLATMALAVAAHLSAQQNDIPLNRDIYQDLDRNHACLTSTVHTGLRPYLESRVSTDGVMGYRPTKGRYYYQITQYIFKKHLFEIKDGDFRATIDPVFQFEVGNDFLDKSVRGDTARAYHNGRGLRITADLGPRVSMQTTFYENQAELPIYLYLYANQQEVVPGQGRIKQFGQRALDFNWAMGSVSYTPWHWLNVQLGHGRHFVGNGYRSLLLSDNTSPYPYIKLAGLTNNGRFQYSTIHAKLEAFDRLPTGESSESLYYWKRASFHHASVNLGRVQLGLFEGTVWKCIDSTGVKPLDPLQLNPVIGINTLANGFNGPNEVLVGADIKVKLTDKGFIYGQLATDGPADERFGWQAGMQWFDLFGSTFHVLLEYDHAAPFLYANGDARVNYAHMGQPLALPMGAYVDEVVGIVDWRWKDRVWLQCKGNMAMQRRDPTADDRFGADIFKSDTPNAVSAGPVERRTNYLDLSASYLLNQMSNMRCTLGWLLRDASPAPDQVNASYVYFTFRTSLFNRYYDI